LGKGGEKRNSEQYSKKRANCTAFTKVQKKKKGKRRVEFLKNHRKGSGGPEEEKEQTT